jgi:hypothetical protein
VGGHRLAHRGYDYVAMILYDFSEHNGWSTSVYTPFSMAWVVCIAYGLGALHGNKC